MNSMKTKFLRFLDFVKFFRYSTKFIIKNQIKRYLAKIGEKQDADTPELTTAYTKPPKNICTHKKPEKKTRYKKLQ
jgi:hypothetical protein